MPPFALIYSSIRNRTRGPTKKSTKVIEAIHVKCATQDFDKIKVMFSAVYGIKAKKMPIRNMDEIRALS